MADDNILAAGITGAANSTKDLLGLIIQDKLARRRKQEDLMAEEAAYARRLPLDEASKIRIEQAKPPTTIINPYGETVNSAQGRVAILPRPTGVSASETNRIAKQGEAQDTIDSAKKRVTQNLETIRGLYQELKNKGGIVNTESSPIANIGNRISSSRLGQMVGGAVGTEEQSVRNQINQIRPLLIQEIRQASKMGARGLDSEKELEFYLQAATDPSRDIESNLQAIQVLDKAYGLSSNSPVVGKSSGGESGIALSGDKAKRLQELRAKQAQGALR